jgi:tetratricopeptide (TPR) repeat protein
MRALLVALALVALPSAAFADKASKARADKLFEDGRGYLASKEYKLACTAFEQSQQADPAIGTQLNIALCYEEWGKLAKAYKAYVEAARQAKAKKDNREKVARKKVSEIEPKLARLRVSIPPSVDPYSIFLFDEQETSREDLVEERLVDAGKHTVEVRVAGSPPKITNVQIAAGEQKSVTIELPAPVVTTPPPDGGRGGGGTVTTGPATQTTEARPRKKGKLYGGIGLMGGGALAVGIASYVALIARSDYNDAIAGCPDNTCTNRTDYDATQDARSRANMMSVVTGAGVAMIGVGVYLVLTSKGDPVKVEKVSRIQPMITNDGFVLAIGGSL